MNTKERDDFAHALTTTMRFYGKTLDQMQFKFWFRALADKPIDRITRAFDDYVASGKFAPKPVDILELIRDAEQRSPREHTEKPYKPCPQHIAEAWSWFIRIHADPELGLGDAAPVSDEEREARILLVNQEARRMNMPDAIPEEYRLWEVWA